MVQAEGLSYLIFQYLQATCSTYSNCMIIKVKLFLIHLEDGHQVPVTILARAIQCPWKLAIQ
jgi:hypothetical protein